MPRRRTRALVSAAFLLTWGCAVRPAPATAQRLELGFEVVENRTDPVRGDVFTGAFTLTNQGDSALGSGWTLYFNFHRDVLPESVPEGVTVTRVNGDFQSLQPTGAWLPLAPGERRRLPLQGRWPVTKVTNAPMGAYLVRDDDPSGAPVPVAVAVGRIAAPAGGHPVGRPPDQPLIPTPASRYRDAAAVVAVSPENVVPVLPTPVNLRQGAGTLRIDATWRIVYQPVLRGEAEVLAEALAGLLGGAPLTLVEGEAEGVGMVTLRVGVPVVGGVVRSVGAEAYVLSASPGGGVRIVGSDPAGVLYGVQSLRALLPVEAYRTAGAGAGSSASTTPSNQGAARAGALLLPGVTIEDAPRFRYRGLHLDVARNFQPKETVEKLLRLMAFYKLNRFHFHLTDDEGWRLEIPPLPELTEVGGRRGHTLDERDRLVPSFGSGPDPERAPGSGFYSRADFIQILRLATQLHIEVVPEIDGPGHARAAVKSMQARHLRLAASGSSDAAAYLLTDPEDRSRHRSVQGWSDNVINPCLDSTYRFLEVVVDEIQAMYDEAGAALNAVHIGGDEVPRGVWEGSPACAAYLAAHPEVGGVSGLFSHFVDRVSVLLRARGLRTAGWEEIALAPAQRAGGAKAPDARMLERGLVPYIWNNVWRGGAEDLGYRLANAGFPVVLANATNLYFDLAYDRDPLEPGSTWAGLTDAKTAYELVPLDVFRSAREDLAGRAIDSDTEFRGRVRLTEQGARNVLGIQGQLWSENANSLERLEYLAFPKLLGLAERAWAAESSWERMPRRADRDAALAIAWSEFATRLGTRELPRLDYLEGGVGYRLPPPGAVLEPASGGASPATRPAAWTLRANVPYPGLEIRYTTDGSEPTASSPRYDGPVQVRGEVRLRAFDTRGRGGREARVAGG